MSVENTCNVCGNRVYEIFQKRLLYKYDVTYFKCDCCGFGQTETPYWLEEAYNSPITSTDIGLLYRNQSVIPYIENLINHFIKEQEKRYLDYAGGYGVLTRMMRDRGYNFYRQDKYCQNMFAEYFDLDNLTNQERRFDLVTAFEVFEHLTKPAKEIKGMLEYSSNIFFSTELQPKNDLENWWYIAPESGQHVSFYTLKSLEILAEIQNMKLFSNKKNLHYITSNPTMTNFKFKLIGSSIFNFLSRRIKRNHSLISSDYTNLIGKQGL
jgi:2-polyprenyl-3-methyl-5-hydroxy-6-metoxy-1,4-benzoquinol methylase